MAFRCWISDDDLMQRCGKLSTQIWADVWKFPAIGVSSGGVVTSDAPMVLTLASGGFLHAVRVDEPVPERTVVNILGTGFYSVAAKATSNTSLTLSKTEGLASMNHALAAGTAYRFVVGGFSEKIRLAYQEIWDSLGVTKMRIVDADPPAALATSDLVGVGAYQDKAYYVPDAYHGLDVAVAWRAIALACWDLSRRKDSGIYAIYQDAQKEYELALQKADIPFDIPYTVGMKDMPDGSIGSIQLVR